MESIRDQLLSRNPDNTYLAGLLEGQDWVMAGAIFDEVLNMGYEMKWGTAVNPNSDSPMFFCRVNAGSAMMWSDWKFQRIDYDLFNCIRQCYHAARAQYEKEQAEARKKVLPKAKRGTKGRKRGKA